MTDKTRDELLVTAARVLGDLCGCIATYSSSHHTQLVDTLCKAAKEQKAEDANQCKCPECGSTNVDYDSAIYDHDEGCCMLFTCADCGAEVKEVYKTTYLRSEVYGHTKENKYGA